MRAELIAVGTEILTGQIVNTNAQFLSEKMAELGIDVYFHTAVGDNEARLLSVLEVASSRSEMVLLCGGLGPTDDDLTKQTLAKFLKRDLIIDPEAMEKLDQFFASRPGCLRTPNNDRQAQLIEGSTPLQNPTGLAVGSLLEENGVTYIVLPGPPSELKAMFQQSLEPLLSKNKQTLYSRVLRFFGIGESQLVTVLADLIEEQTDPTLSPYAKTGEVTLRLSTKAKTGIEAQEKLDELEEEILKREQLATYMYGYGEDNSLAKVAAEKLEVDQHTIAIVEEFTAGRLCSQLINSLKDDKCLLDSRFVTQVNRSEDEACDLAKMIRMKEGAEIGLAIVGQINPSMDESLAQVTVFIALANEHHTMVHRVQLGGYHLKTLRQIACLHTFDAIRKSL
ncbi:competence/damage-inducible protein A [Streptococcus sp. X16XC17]|uniref:competence/damage-inducible protein A n=1 Tax=unclassified Streptococcus TaxID=2608887 RepID=UPI00066FF080|nr:MULTISPECIES: competence/damage-inducible protein A [unclassified Streptococcus]TCD45423.1 competence/damage-inducible protein A [Streptococcus sp. X16XC17]